MSEPFLSEIKIVSFNFPPKGWTLCNGQLLPINQNQALFSLMGTTYGGDGRVNFGLPNLQGRVPIHQGSGVRLGQTGGATSVTLNISQLAAHNHGALGNNTNGIAGLPMLLALLLADAAFIWMIVMNIRSKSAPEIVFAAVLLALATFLMADGVEWLTGQVITIDGGNALATGDNFYGYRSHGDEDWARIRESIRAQDDRDKQRRQAA